MASKRCEKRLTDLTVAETADLFQLAKIAQKMLQKYYDVSSVTVNVQDGPRAGQTVEVRVNASSVFFLLRSVAHTNFVGSYFFRHFSKISIKT